MEHMSCVSGAAGVFRGPPKEAPRADERDRLSSPRQPGSSIDSNMFLNELAFLTCDPFEQKQQLGTVFVKGIPFAQDTLSRCVSQPISQPAIRRVEEVLVVGVGDVPVRPHYLAEQRRCVLYVRTFDHLDVYAKRVGEAGQGIPRSCRAV